MAIANVNSFPIRWAVDETTEDKSPKHKRGIVVKIPRLVGATWKVWAISLITEGIEVIGIRMQTPSKSSPKINNGLCFLTFSKRFVLSLCNLAISL